MTIAPTVLVDDVVDEVSVLLSDTAHDRWTTAQLVTYLNSAQQDLATRTVATRVYPAYVVTEPVKLTSGAKQTLVNSTYRALMVMDITRNMGRLWVTGTEYEVDDAVYSVDTAGARYVCLVSHTAGATDPDSDSTNWVASPLIKEGLNIEQWNKDNLDEYHGGWINAEPEDEARVRFWIPIENDKKGFYVYPQQPNSTALQYVEITYAALPAATGAYGSAAKITLADEYKEAIMDYMLYKAFSRHNDHPESPLSKAGAYFQVYLNNSVFSL